MSELHEIMFDEETTEEVKDYFRFNRFLPSNQDKYFFTDSMSYYKEMSKIAKLVRQLQEAFNAVMDNERYLEQRIDNLEIEIARLTENVNDLVSRINS